MEKDGEVDMWPTKEDLINEIVIEKWSLITGEFRGGDISEKLLKRICRVLREQMEDDIRKECSIEDNLEWELED